jgi:DNA repair exonuclease SbcCD ATPase subunit
MIISQVSLSGFKCFKSPETIQLCSNTSTGLNVLLGKNGAGKSTLFDAVDWVLFHQHSAEVRAMSLKKTVKVEVQLRSNNGKVLIVSRTSVRGKCTLTGILSTNRENRDYSGSEEPSPSLDLNAQEVTRALLDIGVNVKTDSQKLILRQNSNSIAMSEPLQLLQFVEDIAGTTELIRLISDCSVSIRSLLDEVGERVQELSVCSTKLCGILPQVAINVSTLEERLTHEKELYEYFIALKISLETEECALDISQEALDRAQYELSSHMNAINTSTKGAEGKRKLEEDATLTLTHASIIKEKNELTLKMRTLAFELTKKAKLQEEVKKKIKRCKECTVTIVAKVKDITYIYTKYFSYFDNFSECFAGYKKIGSG